MKGKGHIQVANSKGLYCPVCGFELDFEPWRGVDLSDPSFRNCPSCIIEFGFHDDPHACGKKGSRESLWADWRKAWLAEGMPWRGPSELKPKDWDPQFQLRRVSRE